MEISSALRFVQGAVARKNYDVALTHFRIENGSVQSYNGIISLSSPIDIDLRVYPKAAPFVKAIQSCEGAVALHTTPTGRLAVRSGKFRAFVECLESDMFPDVQPEGAVIDLDGIEFLQALKTTSNFIGEDASRPWARGVLFRGQSLFATNNIILFEHWLPTVFPVEVNVPQEAISELLRIGVEPEKIQVSENTVTFFYSDGRWLRSRLYATSWPDLSRVLDNASQPQPFPEGFFGGLEKLKSFTDKLNAVYFRQGTASTSLSEEDGASVDVQLDVDCAFNLDQLCLLEGIAESVDFTLYPAPCLFYGEGVRGAIAGLRM